MCGKDPKDMGDSLKTTFNDGGTGNVCGVIDWEMPLKPDLVLDLHKRYRSHEAIERQLVRQVVAKSVMFSGPLMSSTESNAARRGDLLNAIEDQIDNGVYKTETTQKREKDTWGERTITQATILRDPKTGEALRQDTSPLIAFGLKTFNLAVNDIRYDDRVVAQIKEQQEATAKVVTSIAKAKEAEQRAIEAEKNGQAEAAKARWEQEKIKATETTKADQEKQVAVTHAQKEKEVADLKAQAAAAIKREQILLGEGEAERRKLVMAADGSLDKKLETTVKIHEVWSNALANTKAQMVPQVVTGGAGAGTGGNAAMNLMEIIGVKAARDLAVDMGIQGKR